MNFPTLEAYREKRLQNQQDWRDRQLEGHQVVTDSMLVADAEYTMVTNALDAATLYQVDVAAMRQQKIRVDWPPKNHLWIELSAPLPIKSERLFRLPPQQVAAMWFHWPALECMRYLQNETCTPAEKKEIDGMWRAAPDRWLLELVSENGQSPDTFTYYARSAVWGLSHEHVSGFWACGRCKHIEDATPGHELKGPCIHPCTECEQYLNAWRNRFRQALTIVQKNQDRPTGF